MIKKPEEGVIKTNSIQASEEEVKNKPSRTTFLINAIKSAIKEKELDIYEIYRRADKTKQNLLSFK